jgi:hypothetical protein
MTAFVFICVEGCRPHGLAVTTVKDMVAYGVGDPNDFGKLYSAKSMPSSQELSSHY